jgi:DNA-3-methyladenine glycosylase
MLHQKLDGPGKLTKFLKIDKRFNNLPANHKTGLWISSPPKTVIKNLKLKIKNSPRVGVSYAGPFWSRRRWRFYIAIIGQLPDNCNNG